jgi:hypothetical protein
VGSTTATAGAGVKVGSGIGVMGLWACRAENCLNTSAKIRVNARYSNKAKIMARLQIVTFFIAMNPFLFSFYTLPGV